MGNLSGLEPRAGEPLEGVRLGLLAGPPGIVWEFAQH